MSDEVVEICGSSGSGKTYLCMKMASLALLEQETGVIYIDTTNYVNQENLSQVISNFINESNPREKADAARIALSRFRLIKVFDLEELLIILSMIQSQLARKQMQVNLRMIVIDNLSNLFVPVGSKLQYYALIKELIFLIKSLTKRHFVGVLYTNNTKDANLV